LVQRRRKQARPVADDACLVFLAGEGPSDIGSLSSAPPYREESGGFIPSILRRIVGSDRPLRFSGAKLSTIPKERVKSGLEGHARKAAQAVSMALAEGARAVVYIADVDKTSGRAADATERKKRIDLLREEIEAGFEVARSADEDAASLILIAATPCRMIEAWALGDTSAVAEVGGLSPQSLARPEELWGDEQDPSSNHPKRVLARLLGKSPSRDDFAAIAEAADPERIRSSCPTTFEPFAQAVLKATESCGARTKRESTSS
jgi:hypothetical protein